MRKYGEESTIKNLEHFLANSGDISDLIDCIIKSIENDYFNSQLKGIASVYWEYEEGSSDFKKGIDSIIKTMTGHKLSVLIRKHMDSFIVVDTDINCEIKSFFEELSDAQYREFFSKLTKDILDLVSEMESSTISKSVEDLVNLYLKGSEDFREGVDVILIAICGYCLNSIITNLMQD